MIPTFFTTLAVGVITTGVVSIMALTTWIDGSQIIQGNLFFDTTNNAYPSIYAGTSQVGTIVNTNLVQSGGTIPIYGSLAVTPSNASGGIQSIQNPYGFDVVCRDSIIDVTTSPTANTYLDIGTATGAATQASLGACGGLGNCGSGSDLANNLLLNAGSATGTYTLSGSSLYNVNANNTGLGFTGSYLYPKSFKLNAAGGTTDYINIVATRGQSGSNLAGSYNFGCRRLQ